MRIEDSPLFEPYTDESGVTSYLLTKRIAPIQQGFYFVNNSLTDDCRYLWFYAAFPPMGSSECRFLGCADIEKGTVDFFPDTLFEAAAPAVDAKTGEVWYSYQDRIFRRTPDPSVPAEEVASISYPGGVVSRSSTHLTFTPDRKGLFLDLALHGGRFACGILDLETKRFTVWDDTHMLTNHGQHNPCREGLALMAKDHYLDTYTGEMHHIPTNEDGVYERLWTVGSDGTVVLHPARNNYASHEWWSADGQKIYYVNGARGEGIERLNIDTGEHICVHSCRPWHAHTNAAEEYYVWDEVLYEQGRHWYRGQPSAVRFFNRLTGKEITVCTRNSELDYSPENPCAYHIDPHPHITNNEKYIVWTAVLKGRIDVAVTPMEELLRLTK